MVVAPIMATAGHLFEQLSIENKIVVLPIGLAGMSFMFWALSPKTPKRPDKAEDAASPFGYGLENDTSVGNALIASVIFAAVGLTLFSITAVLIRYPVVLNVLAFTPATFLAARLTKLLHGRLRRRSSGSKPS